MARTISRRVHRRPLNIAIQDAGVAARFPAFRFWREGATGVWRGTLQPQALSPAYTVEVRYNPGVRRGPSVKVLSPPIAKGAPHLYQGGRLCLFWPRERSWRPEDLIAETVLPWTALWLLNYELWLDTGEWLSTSSHAPLTKGD